MTLYDFAQKVKANQQAQQTTNALKTLLMDPANQKPDGGLSDGAIAKVRALNPELGEKMYADQGRVAEEKALAEKNQSDVQTARNKTSLGILKGTLSFYDQSVKDGTEPEQALEDAKKQAYDAIDAEQISDEAKAKAKANIQNLDAAGLRARYSMVDAAINTAPQGKTADKTDLKEFVDASGTHFFKDIHSPDRNLTAGGKPYEPVGDVKPVSASGEEGKLTPEAVKYYSKLVRTMGPSVLGRLPRQERDQVINASAEDAGGNAEDDIKTQFAGKGAAAEQKSLGTRRGQLELAEKEMEGAAKLSQEAYAKLDRSSFRPFNELRMMVEKGTSNPNQARAYAADNAVVNIYARMISPTGQGTDSDKNHAREMLNQAQGPEAHQAVINQLIAEGKNAADKARKASREATSETPIAGQIPDPPKGAGSSWEKSVHYLRLHPDSREAFDKRYGPGEAGRVLERRARAAQGDTPADDDEDQ